MTRAAPDAAIDRLLAQGLLGFHDIATRVSLASSLGPDGGDLPEPDALALVRASWERQQSSLVQPRPSLWRRVVASSNPRRDTSLERLEGAFEALDKSGVMARLYPGEDRAAALGEIDDELAFAAAQGRAYEGYCLAANDSFFGQADPAEPLDDTPIFYGTKTGPLTFADELSGGHAVAEKVARALSLAGFELAWSGDPGQAIVIPNVAWKGWRDPSGTPLLRTGRRLPQGDAAGTRPAAAPARATRVFVSCPPGSPDAHRLVEALARHAGTAMFGDVKQCESSPAAVAVRRGDRIVDAIAGPSPAHMAAAILRRKPLVRQCERVVSTYTDGAWDDFPASRRVFVTLDGAAGGSERDGSPSVAVDLATGGGVEELLKAILEDRS